ncbi:hypothetical protein ACHAXA_002836 [Cyclostephanos tholiformis]|uniref:Uncharacterized protein n=1 Tax=Cyclostephanos tholiformis TaxID=382380 RepID=A0ABD3RZQ2_9STRA
MSDQPMVRSGHDATKLSHSSDEVSCEHNPTRLFLLMNQQLWDSAQSWLYHTPLEARTWISSRFPNSDEYRWRNLPLHLACLHGPEPVPLQFIEALIEAFPEAARCRNHEGNMPIHLACECMDLGPRFRLEEEGILIALIRAFPECLCMKDGKERTPLEILNERSLGKSLAIINYMKTYARRDTVEDERQGREEVVNVSDENMNRDGIPSSRRVENIARPKNSGDRTMACKHNRVETRSQSRTTFVNSLKEQTQPDITEQSRHFFGGDESIDIEDDPNLDPALIPLESQMMFELQQQRDLVQSLLQQQKILVDSLGRPSDPIPIVSPLSTYPKAMVSPRNQSLHQLDAELSSMRNAHESMSLLLSSKTQREKEMQESLRKLEITHAQLKNEYADLKAEHSMTVAKLEEKSNEVAFMTSKQKAISYELALKPDAEERQSKDINLLRNELTKEKEARVLAVENLECLTERCADFEKNIEVSKKRNEELLRNNDRLSMENKEYRAQLAQKNKLLKEAKIKEATLLGLLSKMHDIPSSSSTENLKLLKIIQETKANESKMKSLLKKAKDALTISQKKNHNLQMQLDGQTIELQEFKATNFKQVEQSSELMENNECVVEALSAKNNTMREGALKAIEPVATLLKAIPRSNSSSFNCNSNSLMLKIDDAAPVEGASQNCMLDASQSLELLHPIVCDAMSFQRDSIERIQHLYQYFHDTLELIAQIPSIPHERFHFQPTLKILEETVISHVHIMETLDDLLETKASHKPKLLSLLNQEPRVARKCILCPTTNDRTKIKSLGQGATTSTMVGTKKFSLDQHLHNLERLSKTVAQLPRVNRIALDTKKKDLQLHLNKVDEITSVLEKALTILVQDARQLKAEHETFIWSKINE